MKKAAAKILVLALCLITVFSVCPAALSAPEGDIPLLKNISVAGFNLTPKFNPVIHQYTLVIPVDIEMLNITATTRDGDFYTVSGASGLVEGTNTVLVTVSNGVVTTDYVILVIKGEPTLPPSVSSTPQVSTAPQQNSRPPVISEPVSSAPSVVAPTISSAPASSKINSSSASVSDYSDVAQQAAKRSLENLFVTIILISILVIGVTGALIAVIIMKRLQ